MGAARARGFSLIEMMVVLSIILVLLAALVAPLLTQARRNAYIATCASNLHQITLARLAHKSERGRPLRAGEWDTLKQYLAGAQLQDGVLRCPEDELVAGGVADSFKIGIATRDPKIETNISYHIEFGISPLNVHMSQEQYDQVVWGSQEGKKFFEANPWYTGYDPGSNPSLYYVIFEDIVVNGAAAGDQDFEDIHFKVEVKGDYTEMTAKRGAAGYRHFLFDRYDNNLLGPNKPIPGSWETVQVPLGPSSYGMNMHARDIDTGEGKIFAIDYESTVVKPETWSQWDDARGIPMYARHEASNLNAVYYDGSVKQVEHALINPEFVSNDLRFWQP